jgi:thioesterase III
VLRRRIGPTILEINLKFQRELRNRQPIVIKTWMDSYTGKIGRVGQEIRDAEGNLFCEALFTIGLFDLTARKLIPPTPEWLRALGLTESDLAQQ